MGQFSHHLARQDACREFLATQRALALANQLGMDATAIQKMATIVSSEPLVAAMLNDDNIDFEFVLYDDGFEFIEHSDALEVDEPLVPPTNTNTPSAPACDMEHCNFMVLEEPKENVIINPDAAVFTNERRVEVILLKILTELEAPLWAFQDIMDWAFDAQQSGYKFHPEHNSYKSQIQTIEKWVGMDHMRPTVVNVKLPGKRDTDFINVTTFDFISQFHSLLSDPFLNIPENLVINTADPFTQYVPPDGLLGECLSGSWYKNAWEHMEQNQLGNFMIPIILYIDKTCLSLSGRLSIFPVQMSLGILTEESRRCSNAWRPLGYIANEDFFFSTAERNEDDADVKNERFHVQLDTILASFKKAQQPNQLRGMKIQLGNASKTVDLYVPLQFIIGDVEGGDQLCSRFAYRGISCQRLCRTCDISTENASNTNITCNRIKVADVISLVATQDQAALRALAQRPFFNSLYHIDCANDPYGVFSMIHTEGLHALEVGLIPYMMEILMLAIQPRHRPRLDHLVKRLLKHPRQHGYDDMPRMLWQDGVTGITQLTGDLKVAKMFAICCVASTREGETYFTNVLGGSAIWIKMVYVFQQILCYWAWLKQDTFWMAGDRNACIQATASIKIMIRQLTSLWPRKVGLEWNITKIHEQCHVPEDIHRHGRHKNVHTGPQEHNHITIKNAGKKTQMNRRTFDMQTGERLVDRLIIQRAYDRVVPLRNEQTRKQTPLDRFANPSSTSSKATMIFQTRPDLGRDKADMVLIWKNNHNVDALPLLHDYVLAFIGRHLLSTFGNVVPATNTMASHKRLEVAYFTEYERHGVIYRAHPLYRKKTPYYDWAYVRWELQNTRGTMSPTVQNIIGRILCFFRHPDGNLMAVVHSCQVDTGEQHGVFATYWHLEYTNATNARPKLSMVNVDCLEQHVCMIPYNEGSDSFMWVHIWNPMEWPKCFQTIEPPSD